MYLEFSFFLKNTVRKNVKLTDQSQKVCSLLIYKITHRYYYAVAPFFIFVCISDFLLPASISLFLSLLLLWLLHVLCVWLKAWWRKPIDLLVESRVAVKCYWRAISFFLLKREKKKRKIRRKKNDLRRGHYLFYLGLLNGLCYKRSANFYVICFSNKLFSLHTSYKIISRKIVLERVLTV